MMLQTCSLKSNSRLAGSGNGNAACRASILRAQIMKRLDPQYAGNVSMVFQFTLGEANAHSLQASIHWCVRDR